MDKIKGTIEKVIYQNNDNWYSVCDIETEDKKLATIVGNMPYISAGESVEATGEWIHTKAYGRQFKVDSYTKVLPKEKNSILRYLSSGAIKGVGPKIAEKIVNLYGEDSFDIIANRPDWLAQINGISRKKAYEISQDFREKTDIREIHELFSGNVSPNTSVKVYKRWGKNALGILKENPYCLCTDNFGISFKRADEIAEEMGISKDNPNRIESGIKYVLGIYASRDGHTCVSISTVIDSTAKLLEVDKSLVEAFFNEGCKVKGVSVVDCISEPSVALNELYFAEINIAKRLKHLDNSIKDISDANIEHIISDIEATNGIKYASMQKKAIYESIKNGVMVLTGGPGTGKTTVIKALLQIFSRLGMKCALCAPTGRAAKKMSETTQAEAKTIHRLLDVTPGGEFSEKPKFKRDNANPLSEDVIIVDETSMIDVPLMNALTVAIKTGARLILIGDINQLPSVGEGNVLNDIIESKMFTTVSLNEIFRQSLDSGIIANSHIINSGKHPDLSKKYNDFFFIEKTEDEIPAYIADMCKNRLPKKYGKGIIDSIQVIAPTKKGYAGTNSLNIILQDELNPADNKKAQIPKGLDRVYREGDKVMQIHNNYSIVWENKDDIYEPEGMGIFNGDIGLITAIDDQNDAISIDFCGKRTVYQRSELDEIEHSYCITVHKSQGCEYPIVIIPITSSCPPILRMRNLIYTAITRAQGMVILIGDKDVFYQMIDNDKQQIRNTLLKRLLTK